MAAGGFYLCQQTSNDDHPIKLSTFKPFMVFLTHIAKRVIFHSERDKMYIAIEGVIGVGKTTLARMLQPRFEAELQMEVFEENPFLADFYSDRERLRLPDPDLLPAQPISPAAQIRQGDGHQRPPSDH